MYDVDAVARIQVPRAPTLTFVHRRSFFYLTDLRFEVEAQAGRFRGNVLQNKSVNVGK